MRVKLSSDPTSPRAGAFERSRSCDEVGAACRGKQVLSGFAMWVVLGLTVLLTAQVGDNYYLTNRTGDGRRRTV